MPIVPSHTGIIDLSQTSSEGLCEFLLYVLTSKQPSLHWPHLQMLVALVRLMLQMVVGSFSDCFQVMLELHVVQVGTVGGPSLLYLMFSVGLQVLRRQLPNCCSALAECEGSPMKFSNFKSAWFPASYSDVRGLSLQFCLITPSPLFFYFLIFFFEVHVSQAGFNLLCS